MWRVWIYSSAKDYKNQPHSIMSNTYECQVRKKNLPHQNLKGLDNTIYTTKL